MCQATVYLVQEGQESEVMRDAILLERTEDGVRLHTFFEEPKTLSAQVQRVDFLKHTVMLVALEKQSAEGNVAGLGEIEKLRVLLPHWIEHNAEHAAEFREWAEHAQQANQGEAARHMRIAAESLEEANRALSAALKKLSGPPREGRVAHDI